MIRENYYQSVLKPLLIYRKKLQLRKGLKVKILLIFLNIEIKKKTKEFYKLFDDKYVK